MSKIYILVTFTSIKIIRSYNYNTMKTYYKFILISLFVLILVGCTEDEGVEPLVNQAPEIPILFFPENEKTDVDLEVELKWQLPSDPDGDVVRFDVYLDDQQPPNTLIASGL